MGMPPLRDVGPVSTASRNPVGRHARIEGAASRPPPRLPPYAGSPALPSVHERGRSRVEATHARSAAWAHRQRRGRIGPEPISSTASGSASARAGLFDSGLDRTSRPRIASIGGSARRCRSARADDRDGRGSSPAPATQHLAGGLDRAPGQLVGRGRAASRSACRQPRNGHAPAAIAQRQAEDDEPEVVTFA